jgi:hypothetical protein
LNLSDSFLLVVVAVVTGCSFVAYVYIIADHDLLVK